MAVSQIPSRIFCVFAICFSSMVIVEPIHIAKVLGVNDSSVSATSLDMMPITLPFDDNVTAPPGLFVLPWLTPPFAVSPHINSFNSLKEMNALVAEVDAEDPWVREKFGIVGPGEGIVWYPIISAEESISRAVHVISYNIMKRFMFKAKGESHLVVKQRAGPISAKLEVPSGILDFVDRFLTENRLQQGVSEACDGEMDIQFTGSFVNWIAEDIFKESEAEREADPEILDWAVIKKRICRCAGKWYTSKVRASDTAKYFS